LLILRLGVAERAKSEVMIKQLVFVVFTVDNFTAFFALDGGHD
jgi:hypothetical protein